MYNSIVNIHIMKDRILTCHCSFLKARVWNAWLGRTIHSMEVAHQRISHGRGVPRGFSMGYSIAGWFIRENPIKVDDLGIPHFRKTPYIIICIYIYL